MATQDSVMGLFTSPQQYQQGLQAQALNEGLKIAQLSPVERAAAMGYAGGANIGRGISGMLGAEDPQMKLQSTRQSILRSVNPQDMKSIEGAAIQFSQMGDGVGVQAMQELALKQSQIFKNMKESNTSEQRNAAALADSSGATRGTPEWTQAYNTGLERLTTKDAGGGEFERTLKSLNLPPEQERALKQQRLTAMLNNDSSGIKAITAQLGQLQLQERQFKFDEEKKTAEATKQTAITKLAGLETDIDESLTTAAKAIKLAPNTFTGAVAQDVGGMIPWTDQRALKNLVSSLNSDKAIGTLQELKTQSKTGATGFGALNTKELQLILDKTRALDPADKMFKENLTTVMKGWGKLRQDSIASRENLQGKTPTTSKLTFAQKVQQTMALPANKGKSQADVEASLRAAGHN